jgi:hypothetical protein
MSFPHFPGTAEATPQGKMMNPRCLGTGKAVVKTVNAKVKNRSMAVDPPAPKRAGGTTVNATNVRMAANIAAEDMTARIAEQQ